MTVFPEPVLVGGENFDQWLKEHRASHVRMGIAEPCVCAGCVYARRLERGPVTRYLDTVAAERSKSDWTPPSKHPLSGFTHCFDPEHVPGIIATLDVLRRIGTYGAPK